MKLVDYLGSTLKSDAVLNLLAKFGMEVIYHLDIYRENSPEWYSASAPNSGFEIRFDAQQVLDTIWCHVIADEEFSSVDAELVGVPFVSSIAGANALAVKAGCGFESRESVETILHGNVDWAKLSFSSFSAHYEFGGVGMRLITLSAKTA